MRSRIVMRSVLFLSLTLLLLGAAKCGGAGEEKGGGILLLPQGHFELRKGETISPIDSGVEARYAKIFNSAPEVVQCPLYRSIVTAEGKEFFIGMVLDSTIQGALALPVTREVGSIDTLATDSTTYVWYQYHRCGVKATACLYVHMGRAVYLLGTTELCQSPCFSLDSLRSRFVLN